MKTAVILFNLGGPDSQEAVKPFLFNLFNDKAIISLPQPFRFLLAKFIANKRQKTTKEIYQLIGGKSPLLEITKAQADALEKELSFSGDFKVFVTMRYWHPFLQEIKQQIFDYKPKRIILLPLYPQFSTTTTGSSFKQFHKIFSKKELKNKKIKTEFICCYPTQGDFVLSHAKSIEKTLLKTKTPITHFRILFSAHGLPQKIVDKGDPYVLQTNATCDFVVKKLEEILRKNKKLTKNQKIDYQLCFQSKVGPLEWTKPYFEDELKRAAIDKKPVIIVPIAFVSEHSETLVELDIEYKHKANDLGIKEYLRVPALNVDGNFIKALSKLCLDKKALKPCVKSSKSKAKCFQIPK